MSSMRFAFVCSTFWLAAAATHAAAQSAAAAPPPAAEAAGFKASWEIEAFGGGGFARGGGFAALAAAEQQLTIPTNTADPPVSSWLLSSLAASGSTLRPPVPLTSLQSAARDPDIRQGTRGAFGVHVTRWGSPHTGLDFTVSGIAGAPTRLGGADIEASRASFESAFGALFAASPQLYGNPNVTATTTAQTSAGTEIETTAALILTRASGRLRPFVTVGGGERWAVGTSDAVNVTGHYTFTTPTGAPIDQTDSVTIHYRSASSPVMAFGGGARLQVNAHAGLRVDARLTIGKDRDAVSVDATPTSLSGTPAGFVLQPGTRTVLPLVFSNTPDEPTSLRGPAISGLATAKGTGWRQTWTISAGWFWAF